jgi:hypothetical protein
MVGRIAKLDVCSTQVVEKGVRFRFKSMTGG